MEPRLNETPSVSPPTPTLSEEKSVSPTVLAFRRFRKNKLALAGIVFLSFIVLVAIFADVIATHDPTASQLSKIEAKADGENWLGTDGSGRDNFSRLVYGARISLTVGFFAMLFTVLIGGTLGSIAGYYGGKIDSVIMRFTDIVLIFPFILLFMTIVAILERTTVPIFILVIAITSWPQVCRILRGTFLSIREKEYVLSARSIGCSDWRIIRKHFLPNAVGPIIVNATIVMATMIVAESALSFIGFGVPQPTPTWGNMLTEAQSVRLLRNNPEAWLPPGLCILLTVLSINFIGDGLRDAFDSKA
ncbi:MULTISPECIES: oligopeptide ABC transporter permease [Shouchella]|jgi:peptide/nickel transport system permease protein|uniref:ABC transporter permease n=3 Tax=Bacillaceae TaxID=186817 RepID=A0A268RYL6_SHOCL|nr:MULTISPECIES: oligopeptide ABC transporter permease [Shouchella]MCM3312341.1 ABC transporter permease [Psychrobacillus sp. MER TA 17]PAD44807.1 ABC transporter permease [Bacillus sp. 7520-S]SPU20672.1 oligopeptide ABC transporter permease [Niallia circulans]MBU8596459.1 ABC transporter permease [Shouchella clausii]MBX0317625.1 ABC transporter permease [Shouchella clausii]